MSYKKVLVPLAQGCEEIEAVTIIDVLVRGEVEVTAVSLDPQKVITASRGVKLMVDKTLDEVKDEAFDMIVLPGGLAGADNLLANKTLLNRIQKTVKKEGKVAAICAAPKVLAQLGLLDNKNATSYPGFIDKHPAEGMRYLNKAVVNDGLITTSQGPGTAMLFALELLQQLHGEPVRLKVQQALLY